MVAAGLGTCPAGHCMNVHVQHVGRSLHQGSLSPLFGVLLVVWVRVMVQACKREGCKLSNRRLPNTHGMQHTGSVWSSEC